MVFMAGAKDIKAILDSLAWLCGKQVKELVKTFESAHLLPPPLSTFPPAFGAALRQIQFAVKIELAFARGEDEACTAVIALDNLVGQILFQLHSLHFQFSPVKVASLNA
jgi:hypothetical protein